MSNNHEKFVTHEELKKILTEIRGTDTEHEQRLTRLEAQLTHLTAQIENGFKELKTSIEQFSQIKTWATGVGAAIGTAITYALINLFIHGGHI